MFYINQNGFPYIPYPTNISNPESPYATMGQIESSGCGLCACMMVVDRLSLRSLDLEEAVQMSVNGKANLGFGTDMTIFGPLVAEKFGLKFSATNSEEDLKKCLQAGGAAVIRVGGDNPETGRHGIFCYVDHYVTAISYDEESGEFCILDPAYQLGRYTEPVKAGKVRIEDCVLLYTTEEVLHEDTNDTETRAGFPRYYLFKRH